MLSVLDRLLLPSWAIMFLYNAGDLGLTGSKNFGLFRLDTNNSNGRERCLV